MGEIDLHRHCGREAIEKSLSDQHITSVGSISGRRDDRSVGDHGTWSSRNFECHLVERRIGDKQIGREGNRESPRRELRLCRRRGQGEFLVIATRDPDDERDADHEQKTTHVDPPVNYSKWSETPLKFPSTSGKQSNGL